MKCSICNQEKPIVASGDAFRHSNGESKSYCDECFESIEGGQAVIGSVINGMIRNKELLHDHIDLDDPKYYCDGCGVWKSDCCCDMIAEMKQETTTVIVMGETVELTDEQFDAIQDLYVKCHSCGQYCDAVAPREGEYVCEMCLE